MFYRSADRSTVLSRPRPDHNDHDSAAEDPALIAALVEARRSAEQKTKSKLSAFEKELLQAWAQD